MNLERGLSCKKGVSGVLTVIIFVVLILVAVSIFSAVFYNLIHSKSRDIEARSRFFESDIEVANFKSHPSYVDVSIRNSGGKEIKETRTYTVTNNIIKDTDIVSVIDVSGSMDTTCSGCDQLTCSGAACNDADGCKICDAKKANINFTNQVLDGEGDHRIGVVNYSDYSEVIHPLSKNKASIVSSINSLISIDYGDTCICCGINEATDMLKTSSREKMIILMSDGMPSESCLEQGVTGDLDGDGSSDTYKDDTIKAAKEAYEDHGIKVHTIAFGSGVDIHTLNKTASAGNGSFYKSDLSNLSNIYSKLKNEVKKEEVIHKSVGVDCLRFLFFNGTNSYSYDDCDVPSLGGIKRYIVTPEKNLDNNITNITKVEFYLVFIDSDGEEHISHMVDKIEIN